MPIVQLFNTQVWNFLRFSKQFWKLFEEIFFIWTRRNLFWQHVFENSNHFSRITKIKYDRFQDIWKKIDFETKNFENLGLKPSTTARQYIFCEFLRIFAKRSIFFNFLALSRITQNMFVAEIIVYNVVSRIPLFQNHRNKICPILGYFIITWFWNRKFQKSYSLSRNRLFFLVCFAKSSKFEYPSS